MISPLFLAPDGGAIIQVLLCHLTKRELPQSRLFFRKLIINPAARNFHLAMVSSYNPVSYPWNFGVMELWSSGGCSQKRESDGKRKSLVETLRKAKTLRKLHG